LSGPRVGREDHIIMDKAEVTQIADFLIDVRESLRGGDGGQYLSELHGLIQRLTDASFAPEDRESHVLLASLEYEARLCRQEIEGRSGER
jgi:hypothetical protein